MIKKANFLLLFLLLAASSFGQKYEAESAILSGGATKVASSTASGGYYVAQGDGIISFTINFFEEASYDIYVQLASPYGNRFGRFAIDGSSIDFPAQKNESFLPQKVISFQKLSTGVHKIEITKPWGYINIDFIKFEKVTPPPPFIVNTTLVTPNPTDEAIRLYQFLLDNHGKKIISGVMTLNSMDEINWLKANTGKEPALIGLDFMHCNRGYSWYNDDSPMNDAINYYGRNGIPALFWHWRDPSRLTEFFYTKIAQPVDYTSFDISKIFDETSDEYKAMIKDVDYTSGLLKKFQDNKIPVIWRPLHEAAGGWFWWGAKGPEPYKKLWKLMFDRMVNLHGLHNLIWVWTHEPNDDDWYPGDEYVDMVSRDIYREGDHSSQVLEFNDMVYRFGGKKMVVIGDCGSFPDVDNLIKDAAGWSWFMTWFGDYTRNSKYNSLDLWKKTFANEYVLTLDEMPNLKTYTTQSMSMKTTNAIQVYPTSFDDSITISSDKLIQTISIYNQLGIKIKTLNPGNNTVVVSLAGFPSGTYMIQADENSAVKIFKK